MLMSILDVLRQYGPDMDYVIRLVVATVLGGVIGLERELHDKPAGFRTIILICLGACVFTVVSQVVGGPDYDTTRIAAQIVTGIGFLGAGAIMRDRASVFGLTTAATIWAVAAIGMAVGFGKFGLATVGTVAILVALFVFDVIEHWISAWRDIQEYHFVTAKTDDVVERVRTLFDDAKLRTKKSTCHEDGDSLVFHVRAMGAKVSHDRMRATLLRAPDYTLRRSS